MNLKKPPVAGNAQRHQTLANASAGQPGTDDPPVPDPDRPESNPIPDRPPPADVPNTPEPAKNPIKDPQPPQVDWVRRR